MKGRDLESRNPEYFERMYAASPDPWDFVGSSYERAKYLATLAVLGERNFHCAFEIGCSIGFLTSMLATKCQSLLAVDVVESALVMARETCATLKHVNLQVPLDWPEKQEFDLIICSEVLYFLSPTDIEIVAELVFESLLPGGNVLLVNYTEQIDEPCSGDRAAEIFIKSSHNYLAVQKQVQNKNFRIDLLVTI
jgi:predicted TPR repeat methyltransferase